MSTLALVDKSFNNNQSKISTQNSSLKNIVFYPFITGKFNLFVNDLYKKSFTVVETSNKIDYNVNNFKI